jgi:hypothetical protein
MITEREEGQNTTVATVPQRYQPFPSVINRSPAFPSVVCRFLLSLHHVAFVVLSSSLGSACQCLGSSRHHSTTCSRPTTSCHAVDVFGAMWLQYDADRRTVEAAQRASQCHHGRCIRDVQSRAQLHAHHQRVVQPLASNQVHGIRQLCHG